MKIDIKTTPKEKRILRCLLTLVLALDLLAMYVFSMTYLIEEYNLDGVTEIVVYMIAGFGFYINGIAMARYFNVKK